ncbi:MAG: pyruvate formate lyase family protein [Arenicellales bacterium]|jgi:formate C-acetyltransferase|nr:pyruvate formate lyase family protein [Arenicellales bacterium]HJP45074.1 pyruvate formate lyase family protein [Arenicellales bacterium]|tara:strand:- start:5457 stop:7949 length:2493 start_codon:yes stop_codon:yes gene_type:complete
MKPEMTNFSAQESRIAKSEDDFLTTEEARLKRGRINRMLKGMRKEKPKITVERARLMTESFRETEGKPVALRWALALENVLHNIDIHILDEELIVGRCGPPGRYGILYPELRGAWLEKGIDSFPTRKEGRFSITDEDIDVVKETILPYWKGRTIFEINYDLLPEDTRKVLYREDDPYCPSYAVIDSTTDRSSQQWVPDYEKVLKRGFIGIESEAQGRIDTLDPLDADNNFEKLAFLKSVVIVCRAIVHYAKRHSDLAREMAKNESCSKRAEELLAIANVCEKVPGQPAETFYEAIQSQWFTQVGFRFEHMHGGTIGNGRIDQYLYPYYQSDIEKGTIDDDDVLEYLEHLWLNLAQNVTLQQSGAIFHNEGVPHFEATTIGGQDRWGRDATNELTYLILQSKIEFPLDYPDLAVRIHTQTPDRLLAGVCELIKEGTGFPKLLNDEAVIPFLLAKGASIEEVRDYCVSSCTEVRLVNRDFYMTGNMYINLGSAMEMALHRGRIKKIGDEQFGLDTGDPKSFATFEDMMNAFKEQVRFLVRHCFIQDRIHASLRPSFFASPLQSCLHDLCMEQAVDMQQGQIEGGIAPGFWDPIGIGTAIDSLAALKKLVFDEKSISMERILDALDSDFSDQLTEQRCIHAPKFGNNDPYVDNIGSELESFFRSLSHEYTNLSGGKLDVRYVPVTSHVPLGRIVGALPNGRKAHQPLSEGMSPSQGCDRLGPTASLLSIAHQKETSYAEGGEGVLNMKLTPQIVAGEEGTKALSALIRSWCDLKIWHLQFNIINRDTLIAAQKNPEKYRNLLVRVAGYSSYFVDLSLDLQNEIINRMEHGASC